jgi:phospholipid/cholesterol/gamma-HCH transport system substrate-binding protein
MSNIFSGFTGRMVVLGTFLVISAGMFLFMLGETGTRVPLLEEAPNKLSFYADDIENLVPASQVWIAGVNVGEVLSSEATPDKGGHVIFTVRNEYWPLHEGVTVRIGDRSLVGESYLDIKDGTGAPIARDSVLSAQAIIPGVTLYDVYDGLDPETRKAASSMLVSLGGSTKMTRDGIAKTFNGLGDLGRGGHNAIDAIAAQAEDLEKLANQTATLLTALDTGQGQIADMVTAANKVTKATSDQRPALETTLRLLPETTDAAREASTSLEELSGKLSPVAADLRYATPKLSDALDLLPDTTHDLHDLLDPLQDTLDRAPKTLDKVGAFSSDLSDLSPKAYELLRDINPALDYLQPYGGDLAAFFANFNAALKPTDEKGRHLIRAMAFFNEKTLETPKRVDAGVYSNPYPKPGAGTNPGPFKGDYPKVERLGN